MRLVFKWSASKANHNRKKHKVRFEEAKTVFNDPLLVTFPDEEHSETEDRYISIGLSAARRILLVVHTDHEENETVIEIRIISARKATASERRVYEEDEEQS